MLAGGPKYVAGVSYFNPAVLGQPVHWAGGLVNYYVDQGPLNSSSHQPAGHGHGGRRGGPVERGSHRRRHARRRGLAERGRERRQHPGRQLRSFAQPADVTPSATNYPARRHLRRRRLGHQRPLRRRRQRPHQLPEQRRLGVDGQPQPRRHHRPRHHRAQRPLRHQLQPARR